MCAQDPCISTNTWFYKCAITRVTVRYFLNTAWKKSTRYLSFKASSYLQTWTDFIVCTYFGNRQRELLILKVHLNQYNTVHKVWTHTRTPPYFQSPPSCSFSLTLASQWLCCLLLLAFGQHHHRHWICLWAAWVMMSCGCVYRGWGSVLKRNKPPTWFLQRWYPYSTQLGTEATLNR